MGHVVTHFSMSLDGFVTGPDVGPDAPMGVGGERLHEWLFAKPGDPRDAAVAAEMLDPSRKGAVIIGRRTFDLGIRFWGDNGTFHMPCFVVTHRPTDTLVKGPTSFTFVPSIAEAVTQAQAVAGTRDVSVMGASMVQQFARAGLLDTIEINLIPLLLGAGTRLFESLGDSHVELQRTRCVETPSATHLTFRIVR